MKKTKKLLAIVTAVTLILLPTSTAFAEGPQATLNGSTVSSVADVDYVDPSDVISIVVPTSASMGFTLDPQNLAATQGVATWNPTDGGTILPDTVVTVVNKSAVPVKTTVAFSVTDTAVTGTSLVVTGSSINTGTDKKMYLTVTPANAVTAVSAAAIATGPAIFVQDGGSPATFTAAELTAAGITAGNILTVSSDALTAAATFGKFVVVDENATDKEYHQVEVGTIDTPIAATTATTVAQYASLASVSNAAIVTASGASLSYAIDNAEYYVLKDSNGYSLKYRGADLNDNYDTASFIIGGAINKNADWSGYDGVTTKITLSAAYTFEAMTESAATTALESKLGGSHNSLPVAPTNRAASVTPTSISYSKASGATVAVDLGAGTGATTITALDTMVSGTPYAWSAGTWSVSGSNLILNVNAPINITAIAVGQTRTIRVTFANGTSDTFDALIAN